MKFSQWLSLVILGVCLYIFWQIRQVLLLALTAVVFAVVLNRVVRFLQRWLASRGIAVLALTTSVLLFTGVFGVIFIPPFASQLQELINLAPEVIERLRNWVSNLEEIAPAFSLQNVQSIENVFQQLQSIELDMVVGRFYTLFSNTLTVTLNVLLITVLTFMMLLDPQPYRNIFIRVFPSSHRQQVNRVLGYCEDAIAGWFIGITFNMTIIAIMSTIGLWVLGVPLAFVNGILAGLLAFIPNLGPVISVVPPAAIALLEAPWKAVAVVVLYIVIQQVESNILTPLVMQKQVSLLPAVTLLAQIVFAVFFGFLGLLLALPLTLILQQWLNEFWVRGFADQH